MKLRMMVRDCLYLNWALPAERLPVPPPPLRYQVHSWQGRDYVFASAVLFHQDAVHFPGVPLLRVGYPQMNLRLYVLDGEGAPAVFFRRMLMPSWVAPGVRLLTHQPACRARLDFPRPSRDPGQGPWLWRARRGGGAPFEARAWQDSPMVGEGPRFGSWEQTVRYFHERPRGYAEDSGVLHKLEARHPQVAHWPLRAEVRGEDLFLGRLLMPTDGVAAMGGWPPLHSAFLCPEIPFVFELGLVPKVAMAPSVPHPAAGRVASPVLQSTGHPEHRDGSSRTAAGVVLASAA
jgi:hypothetical protein